MLNTTLCYISRGSEYLMLHRVKKKNDINHDKWIGIGGKFEANGPLAGHFDLLCTDSFFGKDTWEQAESAMQQAVLRQALERLETVMTQAGELTPDQWVDFDGLVDNRFAQKAAGQ